MNNKFTTIMSLILLVWLLIPANADCDEDRFVVLNEDDEEIFRVNEDGYVFIHKGLYSNGAGSWGGAPMVLGQSLGNRGIVITDKVATYPKNIYFGWNPGVSFDYVELFALQEKVGYKNIVFAPNGGYVGIGTTSPSYPLQMGSGAYVTTGGVWTNASSREYKKDIKRLSTQKAIDALKQLDPVEFAYKVGSEERHVGFIAEDVPTLVATKDRKGMSPMDVVAVLTKVVQAQQKTIAGLTREVAMLKKSADLKKGPTN